MRDYRRCGGDGGAMAARAFGNQLVVHLLQTSRRDALRVRRDEMLGHHDSADARPALWLLARRSRDRSSQIAHGAGKLGHVCSIDESAIFDRSVAAVTLGDWGCDQSGGRA